MKVEALSLTNILAPSAAAIKLLGKQQLGKLRRKCGFSK
jgi:hypothetical protein